MRPFFIQGFLLLDFAKTKRLIGSGSVREGRSMLWAGVDCRTHIGYADQPAWFQLEKAMHHQALISHGMAGLLMPTVGQAIVKTIVECRMQGAEAISAAYYDGPLFYRLPEWIGDAGVWCAAADEVLARGVDPAPDARAPCGRFLDLPALHNGFIAEFGESKIWNKGAECVFSMFGSVRRDSFGGEVLKQIAKAACDYATHTWQWPMQECAKKAVVAVNRNVDYAPKEWEAKSRRWYSKYVFSWKYITALLDELRLPACLFAAKTPRA